jgi:DNA-binding MarR family transcriptional regulator
MLVGMTESRATPDVRWLTDPERAAWLALAELVIKLPAALDSQLQRDAGLSHFEYMVLAGLSEAPDRTLRMSDLAMFANGSLSRLSHVVKRLEQRGWVRRAACLTDGRYTNAQLTDEGYAKVVATAPGHVERVRALVVDALDPAQLGQLRDIGETILRRVDPEGCTPERSEPWPGRGAASPGQAGGRVPA